MNNCLSLKIYFLNFVYFRFVKRAESRSLVKFVDNEAFLVYGVPNIVYSDNGTQFITEYFKKFLKAYNVRIFLNAYYHPQVNPAKRINRVIYLSRHIDMN